MTDYPTSGNPPMIGVRLSIPEWLNYVANYNFGSLAPSRLVLHHTYIPDESTWRGITTMRGMQNYYAGLGWNAAPHIYCAPDGIWLFTPMSQIGIHAGTGNGSLAQGWYSIGLEMVGYFDTRLPTPEVWNFARTVMGSLSRRLNIAPRQLISFHRDYTSEKSCPGWAVTKPWVFGEVEAWLNNVAPPPTPPPGPIGTPTPNDERLIETLLRESYARRSQGYNANWAFHQAAVQQGLGAPIGPSTNLNVAGRVYNYQPFGRDTLYCEVPNWGDVQSLNALNNGNLPATPLARALTDATFRAGGATFRPEWAFHQYALRNRLGPAIGESTVIVVNGAQYSYQVFAADTLYNVVPRWGEVRQLSQLANAGDPPTVRLRETLLAETYRRGGTFYRADWAFHQFARRVNVGVPLGNSTQITVNGATYAMQPYALDTLYNLVPNWGDVRRLSGLLRPSATPLGAAASPRPRAVLRAASIEATAAVDEPLSDTPPVSEPPPPETPPVVDSVASLDELGQRVVQHAPPSSACGSRRGSPVDMLIIHGVPGDASEALARMGDINARFATHYYISDTGQIHQLVDESKAAWHAGFTTLDNVWYNLNRISIGIGLERPAGWPTDDGPTSAVQRESLCWLVGNLARRYRIPSEGVALWGFLAAGSSPANDEFPLAELQRALND
ncbi:MAG: N-acetylmuramoyl-L-alanine amidase [Chloroflexaceae bacterium]|nr:N-acetylmuramoyl-L-alanine amidase [Chloroflexaceae bacterium]